MIPTAERICEVLKSRPGWTPRRALQEHFPRNVHFMRAMRELENAGIIERRAETLTTNRGPGWLGEELRKRFGEAFSREAMDFAHSYRLKERA